ncbi:MAG: hypothetical protein Q7S18_03455 [bacterium]|nr:hypothetical protein [bacterium]
MSFEKQELQPKTMPKDEFFAKAQALTEEEMRKLGAVKKEKNLSPENIDLILKTIFQNPETRQEQTIEINLEKTLNEQKVFYRDKLNLEIDEGEVISIWNKNYAEIKSEIEKYGYDEIMILPDNLPSEVDVNKKAIENMDEGAGKGKVSATKYWVEQQSISSVKEDKCRIILVHSAQNFADHPLLKATKGKNIISLSGLNAVEVKSRIDTNQEIPVDFEVEINNQKIQVQAEGLTLREYEIAQWMYFEKNHKHLDENGWTWLMKSRSGSRVVVSDWGPGGRRVDVRAYDPGYAGGGVGLRLSRSFSN